MKRLLFLISVFFLAIALFAQSNKTIKELEHKRGALQKQIAETETLLKSTKKDVGSQLNGLAALSGQIEERKRYITAIGNDVEVIGTEVSSLFLQLRNLERDLIDKKKKYESSVQYLYKNKSIEEKLMFIFSAKSLSQTYRRLRYVKEYATYQRIQGEEILKKQAQINRKKLELEQVKTAKENLLNEREQEKAKLEGQEKQKKTIVASLQKKQKGLQNEIYTKRKEASKLNARIDNLIAAEIAKAKRRAEEEARREAAAARKAEAARREEAARKADAARKTGSGEKTSAEKKHTEKAYEEKETVRKPEPATSYSLDRADRQLSGSFERNRGLLPVPITGSYMVVSHYGEYSVEGLRNVKLDNKGIDIQGRPGANARAVFDGEVSAVFQFNGLVGILVRHGNYISVYCNLSSASVRQGDKVRTRQSIGRIYSDPSDGERTVLHFQLRKETTKLNPETWIDR